jgi:hypothetical protein
VFQALRKILRGVFVITRKYFVSHYINRKNCYTNSISYKKGVINIVSKYVIEVDTELESILASGARERNMSVEQLIRLLLHRFAIDPHSIKAEDMKDGYEACGELNLQWANLK